MKTLYQTSVTVTGGRNGKVQSEDGVLELEVRTPKELGGPAGYTNPEQLFAAGYAACFDSALNVVMNREKIHSEGPSTVKATVALKPNGEGGYALDVALAVTIPGIEKSKARELVEKAHKVCPYSNAIVKNVNVQLEVIS
ncbi:organic hydroperoxide resistance protein [Chitinophagaceae bacterium LB-8]|jgi:lipoyl-dependent peroxiredoxin|uniref:Organic hydroperoxide resistance protein n=1 Tax=Paraflavisolibacter caeni TaxID=2982496 RepID=A0A9X3B8A8_9BACT|nr:organic hydroperoxide resistance protein [Paraflavisolibacter caeni]MCU7550430.1 organic hydroperoxide resistance protein [Paraflavisolibacter caeni]